MFCRNCAEVLLETDITCPKCGFAAGTGIKYCANCGSETMSGSVVCEICGQSVSNFGSNAQFQAQPQFQQQFQQQQFQQQPQFQQQFQQPGVQQMDFQQTQTGTFQQPGAQTFRTVDPNASAFGQNPAGYGAPNTFQQNINGQLYQNVTYKSKVVAGLLGIFLGAFGAHNFYLGYTSKAITQLLLLTVGACFGLGPLIAGIWGLVEGIMCLTGSIKQDAKGLPLKD